MTDQATTAAKAPSQRLDGVHGRSAPGMLARVGAAVRLVVTGKVDNTTFFGPLEPLAPVAQDQAVGRRFDYNSGRNINTQPRSEGDGNVSFAQLRALADNLDVLRLVIETRKDQVAKLKWAIQPKDKTAKAGDDPRCKAVAEFLDSPDKENSWDSWSRQLTEDMLVIDAATIYPRRTRGGALYSLDLIDGATIKPVIDGYGRRPLPPLPAYSQVLHGLPAADYSADELHYLPRNRRTHKVYGYSQVEQIVISVNMGLRRQMQQLQYYTEGTIPEALVGVPDSWTPDNIDAFQSYFDDLMTDNMAQRRKVRFMPGDLAKNFIQTKEAVLKNEFDEWLARIVCYAFNVSSQWAVKQMNRATAESAQEQALQEGLAPVKTWIKSVIDQVLVLDFGCADLEFAWQDEEELSPAAQDAILSNQLKLGIITINQYLADLGREGIGPNGDVNLIYFAQGVVTLDSIINPPPPPPQLLPPILKNPASNGGEGSDKAGLTPDQPVVDHKKDGEMIKITSQGSRTSWVVDHKKDGEMIKAADVQEPPVGTPVPPRSAATLRAEKALTIIFNDLFKSERKRIAAKSRDLPRPMIKADDTGGDDIGPLDPAAWDAAKAGVAEVLTEAAQDGVSTASAAIGVSTDLTNPRAIQWAQDHSAKLINDLEGTTLSALQATIAEGEANGWSVRQLANAIRDIHAFSDDRAMAIAHYEARAADNQGNLLAWQSAKNDAGVAVKKRAIPRGTNICAECLANAAQGPIDVDEAFDSGDDTSPFHLNCECDVEPELADDADTEEES